jgi:hypothetical protein
MRVTLCTCASCMHFVTFTMIDVVQILKNTLKHRDYTFLSLIHELHMKLCHLDYMFLNAFSSSSITLKKLLEDSTCNISLTLKTTGSYIVFCVDLIPSRKEFDAY